MFGESNAKILGNIGVCSCLFPKKNTGHSGLLLFEDNEDILTLLKEMTFKTFVVQDSRIDW